MSNVPGVTLKQSGEELGVNAALLGRWRRRPNTSGTATFPYKDNPRDEEMAALKRELGRVR